MVKYRYCLDCGERKRILAMGLCALCYQKQAQDKYNKKNEDKKHKNNSRKEGIRK